MPKLLELSNETAYLLASSANAARLVAAIEEIQSGAVVPRGLVGDVPEPKAAMSGKAEPKDGLIGPRVYKPR